ncbi:hypothetical protein [Curtobacterium sp. MCBD17_021]|uniref:hypothetical protein n=1 Tax=Curtobacterium sp. MCBD17_021 TaxID=2175665 RepID=UPI000DA71A2F|nr:hypothetical protein [Curtobacterium sp. MCBD17_021]PZE65703.1 hypothetical protein DEI83_09235 [Curtobacterium sp. MCBD17_021]
MDTTTPTSAAPFLRHSHEIAAAITLRAGARALVGPAPLSAAAAVVVTTTCGALATRIALLRFLADPSPADASGLTGVDPFTEPMPAALLGRGPAPDPDRVRRAGDRCVEAWRAWSRTGGSGQTVVGVAGALALGAWCSWALGSELRAATRARYALDLGADDPLATLVDRMCRTRRPPAWRR